MPAPRPGPGGGGTDPSFEQFIVAISGQESGGNYGVVNRDSGALGKYQIMPANVGPWSQKYLGTKITPQQFLASPALQEKLARAVLYDYYSKWGARGAASAWYSGSPNNANNYRSQGGYPSIGSYVDQVISRALHINQADAAAQSGKYATGGTVTEHKTTIPVQETPIDKLGPQDDKAGPLGMAGMVAPGAEGYSAPGAADAAVQTPGIIGADRQQVLDQINNNTEVLPTPKATPQSSTTTSTSFTNVNSAGRQQFLNFAQQALGVPYVWGGAGPGGYDCSGLIYWAMKQAGYNVPRLAASQMGVGPTTSWANLQPGDFIGWDHSPGGGADHIAIYIGNNQILEAPHTGLNVRIRDLSDYDKKTGWAIDTSSLFK